MTFAFQHPVGRLVSCAQMPRAIDKWAAFDALSEAGPTLDLNHRTLAVLRALLTFLPDRQIICDGLSGVVFPSNRTLSDRLSGMPESTLRRHLATLVERGIVSRRDSPNRKRYARRRAGAVASAFGFDLTPLAHAFEWLQERAEARREALERCAILRDELANLLPEATQNGAPEELLEAARKQLRRRPDEARLTALRTALSFFSTPQMSATNSQNERHIYTVKKSDSDSVQHPERPEADPGSTASPCREREAVSLDHILRICPEHAQFSATPVRSWTEAIRLAQTLAPMMGIDPPVLHQAERSMGAPIAAATVFCMLEKLADIRAPGAYLRRLSQRAEQGGFSLASLLAGTSRQAGETIVS